MIRDYANHAANERTYLAWVRTGIAVIALGFVIEKFNFFAQTVASTIPLDALHRVQAERRLEKLSGPLGSYGGVALVAAGIALIAIATARFLHTEKSLDAPETWPTNIGRAGLLVSCLLVLLIAGFSAYLAVG